MPAMETKPLAPGTTLKGKYRIARLVAGGGMAWVYEVEELRPDGSRQMWAMKELRADADDTHTLEEGRRLFEQEANILVRLSHPNLPKVAAFFDENGRSYLVMEFVHGESLEKRLEHANAPILEGQVLDWAVQVCDVLHYLHTRPTPVIFRDMKPSNVMVTPEGRIKLIDFGIARTYKAGQRRDTITMGSENYAAPEQWGKAQTDARADIYGLGATIYHLLANVPPLPAFVPTPRVPIEQYSPAVTERTAAVVRRAMAEDREARYPTAAAMRDALMECLPRSERRRIEARSLAVQASADAPVVVSRPTRQPQPATVRAEPRPVTAPAVAPAPVGAPIVVEKEPAQRTCPRCREVNRPWARYCRRCGYPFVPPLPPVLSLTEPVEARWEYPLRDGSVLIGRRGGELPVDLDLEFYDPEGYVSRNHARITAQQRRYLVADIGSANGTYVNEERLTPHRPRPLRQGDRIRLGRIVLRFQIR
jgi:ribosomal protein L40E